jgi:NADH:ubiquinone oxidoreductase subunit 4 (subunit M)
MPQIAAYTAVRLLVGHADGVAVELEVLAIFALVTAVYGAALSLVQRDLRGFIGTFAMSQSAIVLAGLSGRLPMELNGAFCIWISSGLAITGIGLVTWALESRAGAIASGTIDWATGELLAYATLLVEGHPIRLSGQDVERGTFSHRHAVVNCQDTNEGYCQLNNSAR